MGAAVHRLKLRSVHPFASGISCPIPRQLLIDVACVLQLKCSNEQFLSAFEPQFFYRLGLGLSYWKQQVSRGGNNPVCFYTTESTAGHLRLLWKAMFKTRKSPPKKNPHVPSSSILTFDAVADTLVVVQLAPRVGQQEAVSVGLAAAAHLGGRHGGVVAGHRVGAVVVHPDVALPALAVLQGGHVN